MISQSQIIFRYNTFFAKKYGLPVLNEKYEFIDYKPNSGHQDLNFSFNIKEIVNSIDTCLSDYDNLFLQNKNYKDLYHWTEYKESSDNEIWELLIRINDAGKLSVSFLNEARTNMDEIRGVLMKFYMLKHELINLLLDYLKYTNKAEKLEFDEVTLENFNMGVCFDCKRKDVAKKLNQ